MREIDWGTEKDQELRRKYGFGFERVVAALSKGALLDDKSHPNAERYSHQRQLIVQIDSYVWVVPYVEDDYGMFLKTMFPSRKATKEYLGRMP
jgi:hypothetical protein